MKSNIISWYEMMPLLRTTKAAEWHIHFLIIDKKFPPVENYSIFIVYGTKYFPGFFLIVSMPAHPKKNTVMLTFLITCKIGIIHLGITSIIHDLFPEAVLLHAYSHQECLSILQDEKVGFMISDATIDGKSDHDIIRNARAIQPDTKIIMLLEDLQRDNNQSTYPAGAIDGYIGKNAPIDYIRTSMLHLFSGMKA